MAKLPMKKIFIIGLRKDGKKILDLLQREGVVEVKTLEHNDSKLEDNYKRYASDKLSFERFVKSCDDALEILDKYAKDTNQNFLSSFEGAKEINKAEYESRVKDVKPTIRKVNKISEISKEIVELNLEIPKLENKILQYEPWKSLDLPLNCEGTKRTVLFIGSFKNQHSLEDIYNLVCGDMDENISKYIDIEMLSSNKDMTCVIISTLKEYKDKVSEVLSRNDFTKAPLSSEIPSEEIKKIEKDVANVKEKISKKEEEIKTYATYRDDIKFCRDYYQLRQDKYDVITRLEITKKAYYIEGYVPAKYVENVVDKINNNIDSIYVEVAEIEDGEEIPVALENNFYADPLETVVESYSMPNQSEVDPTSIISIFYYMFFGLMLSDAGYGLLVALGTGILLMKVKNMKPGLKKMMKLFCFGGCWAFIWGILFGSFFGNAVDVIAMYVRGDREIRPVLVPFLKSIHLYWFNPVEEPMRLLVFAFALGIIHLFTGLFIKGYICIKQKAYADLVYDVIFWFMFAGGGLVYLLTMEMVTGMIGLEKPLGQPVPFISGLVAGLGCLGIVLTSGRESKNWFKRILKGAYGAYGITSWLSDVLSYSRLLALGLATGIIAEVFNTMGSMVDIPCLGLIIFILVFAIGHLLNLGINILGAYVHTNRLQYVEFFGKFYEGGGKKYSPFTQNTKYYYIKEEN